MVDFRLGRLQNTAPAHKSKFRERVGFISAPGGPREVRVASGGCFLLVFAENGVRVIDFRLGRLENIAPVHESKLRKRVDFPCTAVLQSPAGLPPHMISCFLEAFGVLEACLRFETYAFQILC